MTTTAVAVDWHAEEEEEDWGGGGGGRRTKVTARRSKVGTKQEPTTEGQADRRIEAPSFPKLVVIGRWLLEKYTFKK